MTEQAGPSGMILVVDDDDLVLRTARRILTRAGYRVLQAGTVEQGWAKYTGSGKELSLVLTDQSLPDGEGLDLAERIRAEQRELPIVLMTGWNADGGLAGDRVRIDAVVRKPFDRAGLLEAVNGALEADRS